MDGIKMLSAVVLVTSLIIMGIMGGELVKAQVHHVVGGESGWHSSSHLSSWAASRNFTVGDHLWFGYVTADDSVVELQSMEEYLSCDLDNPIRMLTDGVDKISLEEEGVRYFASGNLDNCRNGLKLQLNVVHESTTAVATGPIPSFSPHNGLPSILFIGLLLFSMGF